MVGLIGIVLRNRFRWLWFVSLLGSVLFFRRILECLGWFLCFFSIVGFVRIRMINDDYKFYFIIYVCFLKYLYNNFF